MPSDQADVGGGGCPHAVLRPAAGRAYMPAGVYARTSQSAASAVWVGCEPLRASWKTRQHHRQTATMQRQRQQTARRQRRRQVSRHPSRLGPSAASAPTARLLDTLLSQRTAASCSTGKAMRRSRWCARQSGNSNCWARAALRRSMAHPAADTPAAHQSRSRRSIPPSTLCSQCQQRMRSHV